MTPVKDCYLINKVVEGSKLVMFENQGHRLPYLNPKKLAKEINLWWTQIQT